MCVWAANDAATTSGISIVSSPSRTAQAASRITNHASSGMYGFHGCVSTDSPKPRTRMAITAATSAMPARPRRRCPIQSARPTHTNASDTVATSIAQAEPPNSRYPGASNQKLNGPGWLPCSGSSPIRPGNPIRGV